MKDGVLIVLALVALAALMGAAAGWLGIVKLPDSGPPPCRPGYVRVATHVSATPYACIPGYIPGAL